MITFIPRDKVSKNWVIIAPILSIVFTILSRISLGISTISKSLPYLKLQYPCLVEFFYKVRQDYYL